MGNRAYTTMSSCEWCSEALTTSNHAVKCPRCARIMCRRCHSTSSPLCPCLAGSGPCAACRVEVQRVEAFTKRLLPVLKEGAVFSAKSGRLFASSEAVWLQFEAPSSRVVWKSMRLERNKPVLEGATALRAFSGVARRGSELTVLAEGSTAVTVTADKEATAELWEQALAELLSLKHAILGEPTENPARLVSSRNVPPDERASEALLKRQSDEEGKSRLELARQVCVCR